MRIHQVEPLSETDYLRLEAGEGIRHEFVDGTVFAMTGGTAAHNTVAGNVYVALRAHVRNTPCRVFMNEMRVRVARSNAYYYPDIVVAFAPGNEAFDLSITTLTDPLLIIEVFSPSTETTDRREKLLAYRTIASLMEYVLVDPDVAKVEIHRRQGDIGWQAIEYSGPEDVALASVGLTLAMRDIYEGVPVEALARHPGKA